MYLSVTRRHRPPTKLLQTTHILHHLKIAQDLTNTVDLTFHLLLQSLWPPSWPFFVLLCKLQLCCVSALSCAAWRSRPATKSLFWPRAPLLPLPAAAQGRPRGSLRWTTCRTFSWNHLNRVTGATRSCKAEPHPAFWHCSMWAGSTQACISALISALKTQRRWLCLSQVGPGLLTFGLPSWFRVCKANCAVQLKKKLSKFHAACK